MIEYYLLLNEEPVVNEVCGGGSLVRLSSQFLRIGPEGVEAAGPLVTVYLPKFEIRSD